jgi:hypothetical protein
MTDYEEPVETTVIPAPAGQFATVVYLTNAYDSQPQESDLRIERRLIVAWEIRRRTQNHEYYYHPRPICHGVVDRASDQLVAVELPDGKYLIGRTSTDDYFPYGLSLKDLKTAALQLLGERFEQQAA